MNNTDQETIVVIDYTNWKGKRREREIIPHYVGFGKTEFHPETQWLLYALDVEDDMEKAFAIKDIHSWKPKAKEVKNGNEG